MANEWSTREVLQHHAEALGAENLEEIVADYSDDAIFTTPDGVLRGKDRIREAFTKLLADVPQATRDLPTQIYEDDVLLSSGPLSPPTLALRTGSTRSCFETG